MSTTYTTRNEAIQTEIVAAIDADDGDATDYNIDAIADAVLGDHHQGYACQVDADEFWEVVMENRRETGLIP